jgi:hypothetical protein
LLATFISLGHLDRFYFRSLARVGGYFLGGGPITEVHHPKEKKKQKVLMVSLSPALPSLAHPSPPPNYLILITLT